MLRIESREKRKHPELVRRMSTHVSGQPMELVSHFLVRVLAVLLDHSRDHVDQLYVCRRVKATDRFDVQLLWTVTDTVEHFHQELLSRELVLQWWKEVSVGF